MLENFVSIGLTTMCGILAIYTFSKTMEK